MAGGWSETVGARISALVGGCNDRARDSLSGDFNALY